VSPGWAVENNGLNKSYREIDSNGDKTPWTTEWGQSLLTDVAARFSPSVSGRILFELQGDYADRFWRPINEAHRLDQNDEHFILRQAEGKIKKENWYLDAFSGVSRPDWRAYGDFFRLYPETYFNEDYLGSSGFYGICQSRWNQNLFLNISETRVPQGLELGGSLYGIEAAAATGSELNWGYSNSYFGRVSVPVQSSKITAVYKDEDAPFAEDEDERDRAGTLSLETPFGSGNKLTVGAIYRPFRSGETYLVARETPGGSGLLGSSYNISQKTSHNSDGLGGRLRLEMQPEIFSRLWFYAVDLTHLGILAGNKNQIDVEAGTHISAYVRSDFKYTYRKPIEGPIPFLYEGTPANVGAIAANPRGPESPFNVNWSNREAAFFLATFQLNPDKYTSMFQYDPQILGRWNLFKEVKDKPFSMAVQYRMSDYKTTTDRQYYWDDSGEIVWESAAHSGAWASDHPLNEFRVIGTGTLASIGYFLGFSGGQMPAISSLAYDTDTSRPNKSLTEYWSVEAELALASWAVRGHYGSGIWGPEPNIHPFWGESYDRLWGAGVSYKITSNTVWDLNYIGARQDDNLFLPPSLGPFDEIRTTFSHRFGFEFQFQEM